ncbi:hypothetical protein PaMx35_ORF35 [Pseudomonas phage PaMx35]|uniref:Uncharacterized protein n=1 Tax=Pseudomonas phage PaMx41 TaxID=1815976 RepID=A0A1C8HUD8_BPPP4|nr:hypothetical protein KNT55_gp36 [Pseudomonas phage PaMx41]ANA48942.1 hypothetical protein PaMx35_ORF35 [Pseudomonas phage PaMx35]ANA48998.1 hypothetical protein PaMx41_ORF35 [Pseudomonas phage PaMx41]QBP37277.1 hypothetical protein TF_36 [Pseudomonas phage vB_PaeP_TF17]
MADFCKACSLAMWGEDFGDLAGITKQEDWDNGKACNVICEGCGVIQVDPEGECVSSDCIKAGKTGHGTKAWNKGTDND